MKVYKTLRFKVEAFMETASYEDDGEDPAADYLREDRVASVILPVPEDWIGRDLNPSEKLDFAQRVQSLMRTSCAIIQGNKEAR